MLTPHLFSLVYAFKTYHKFLVFACLLLGAGNTLFGQNLIRNPSFEQMHSLPTSSLLNFDSEVYYWYSGNMIVVLSCHVHSTYIFNSGFPNPTPFQMPRTGDAVAMYKTMEVLNPGYTYKNERSYPAIKLAKTIQAGEKVYGEFWISYYEGPWEFPSGNHGMHFAKDSIFEQSYKVLYRTPQINEPNVVSDSVNWIKISGTFLAQEDLNYVVIGNFFEHQNTNHTYNQALAPNNLARSVYFIDDVKVRILNPETTDTVQVCLGDKATLMATGEENHQWAFAHSPSQIESTDSIFSFEPDSSQTVHFYGSFDTLTSYVMVDELTVELGHDTLICAGDDFWLTPNVPNADSIFWNGTLGAASLKITETGNYTVKVVRGSCTKIDNIFVEVANLNQIEIQKPETVCLGDELTLWVKNQTHATYLWSTGETDTAIVVTEDGHYSLSLQHPCGTINKNIDVVFEKCICRLFVANAFSPNGDGINDEFFPVYDCSIKRYFISITDRWGNVLFQSENPEERWDGQNATAGVYTVRIFYQGLNEEGQTVGDDLVQLLNVIR